MSLPEPGFLKVTSIKILPTKTKVGELQDGTYKGSIDSYDGLFLKVQDMLIYLDDISVTWTNDEDVTVELESTNITVTSD